ncbi:uncharacterized protein [Haliotis asinina]|uniref:uncharacterized protein n=1 Tax=Haliotis asinina TaxID=109174 RepID=UPI0035324DCD
MDWDVDDDSDEEGCMDTPDVDDDDCIITGVSMPAIPPPPPPLLATVPQRTTSPSSSSSPSLLKEYFVKHISWRTGEIEKQQRALHYEESLLDILELTVDDC